MAETDALNVSLDAGAESPAAEPPDSNAAASRAPAPPASPWLLARAWIVANALAGLLASFFEIIGPFYLQTPGLLAAVVTLQLLVVRTFLGKRRLLFFWALAVVVGLGVGTDVVIMWMLPILFAQFGPVSDQRQVEFVLEGGILNGFAFLPMGVGQAWILAHVTGKRRRCWVVWLLSSFAGGAAAGLSGALWMLPVPLIAYSVVTAAPLAMLSRHIPSPSIQPFCYKLLLFDGQD